MKHAPREMPKAFDPKAIEAGWYVRWEKAGLFAASTKSDKPRYTICLPPPNVTGELHMGHARNGTVQDIWARYRRMTGHEVLFLPGTDHAAIATQNVIEKRLAKEGTSKEEIGRDAFAELVDEWYRTVGATIVSQYRVLGASLDWTRQRFTMDERYVRAVQFAFVAFYERGWIYRAPRIVNWCPHDLSAISDLEVKWQTHDDVLYFIKYPIEGGGDVAIIEPLISEQWWLRMDKMRNRAVAASEGGKVRWHPERYERIYLDWMGGLRDWNISRQLWLGHRVPVYHCDNGHVIASVDPPEQCTECGSAELTQDTDVLDTWFSSALWPFATLGWPEATEDLRTFYPGNLNTTARDIIRLWENRMIFSGLELMGDVPFTDVVIHSTVHAPTGGRMSKSLGTGMSPLALIDSYGADATRYGLMKMASSQDVTFAEGSIDEGRKLANKLWNASRLLLQAGVTEIEERPSSLEERWILARLSQGQRAVEAHLDAFDFTHLVQELYHLTFDDFCDWYLEAIKPRIYEGDADALATAGAALERLLKLLHPAMPHVTEEIWSNLPSRETRLIVAPGPDSGDDTEAGALQDVQEAAERFRRSGVLTPLTGEKERIFAAVVRPERV